MLTVKLYDYSDPNKIGCDRMLVEEVSVPLCGNDYPEVVYSDHRCYVHIPGTNEYRQVTPYFVQT